MSAIEIEDRPVEVLAWVDSGRCGAVSAHDLPEPEGSRQMIDKGANDWRQAAARCENEVNDSVLGIPLREDMDQASDDGWHLGLVVDDREAVRQALAEAGVEVLPGPFLDFRDPWSNRIEIVGYDNVQFTKAPNVLRGMG